MELEGLGGQQVLDGEDAAAVLQRLAQLERGAGAEAQVVFLQAGSDEVIHNSRLRQLAVLASQRGGDVLADHHPGVDPGLAHQEGRQAADQRVDQAIQAPLGDAAQLGHGNGQQVRCHRHRLAVGVGLGHDLVAIRRPQQQRIVVGRGQLGVHLARGVGQLVAAGAVDLGNGTDAQGVLGTDATAFGHHLAAREQGQQVGAHRLHAGVWLEGDDVRVEGGDLPAQGFEAHGTDHVGPAHQALGVVQG
ncbi:hypothetical protein D3C85_1132530 [compost metagenome]